MKIAYNTGLYCINQTGTLPYRSTVNAAVLLQHWIKESQFTKKKISSDCLDVKGGFDNVDYQKLLDRLEGNPKVLLYLNDWIRNFIATRNISLAYPESPRRSYEVDNGIPQGSPLSSLLFVMYVKPLHLATDFSEFCRTSYLDDFQIMVASN